MHGVITAADARDEPLIVLLGHPDYYRIRLRPRYRHPVADWEPAFFARTLTTYDSSLTGEFRYAEPFRHI